MVESDLWQALAWKSKNKATQFTFGGILFNLEKDKLATVFLKVAVE